jgi:hypothetical protein
MSPSRPARPAGPIPMSTFPLGPRLVRRSGYGAMQLAGPLLENLAAEHVALDDQALRELAGVRA